MAVGVEDVGLLGGVRSLGGGCFSSCFIKSSNPPGSAFFRGEATHPRRLHHHTREYIYKIRRHCRGFDHPPLACLPCQVSCRKIR